MQLSKYLLAPETYFPIINEQSNRMKQDKSLTFSLGLLFLEILSQRPISIVPEQMTAQQYSQYIYRKNRLENLTKLICKCSFNHDD